MKRKMRFNSSLFRRFCLGIVLMIAQKSLGQSVDSALSVLNIAKNAIHNSEHLQKFYEKLEALKSSKAGQINIIHIGDSHIQADFLTEVVRRNLQAEFGNAGRGLIVPARVAGTNEPVNFRTFTRSNWTAKRIVHPSRPLPVGIGGITVNTTEDGASFDLVMNDPLVDYSFNTVSLFYDEGLHSFNIAIQDSLANQLALITPRVKDAESFSKVVLPASYSRIAFQTLKQNDAQKHASLFGLSLENGKPGVLYHSIGVNGAKYEHYNAADLFVRQTQLLRPDLIIISLGTNESVEYPYVNKNLPAQISKFINSLASHNPEAEFLLITPPDAFIKKVKPNPGIETVRMQIIEFAVENGFAFWDMYKVNGGKSSAHEWKMRGLLRPDGIHFSREGYAHQGFLLYEAIMRGYSQYVSDRHP